MLRNLRHSTLLLGLSSLLSLTGQIFAEELPAVQLTELGANREITEVVQMAHVEEAAPAYPPTIVTSTPNISEPQDTSPLAAEMLFASSVQLSMSGNSIEQRAGDILFKQYVDKYGANHQGLYAPKEAGVGNSDILSGVQSLLSKAGVDIKQLKNKMLRQDWSGVEESLHEARENKALDQDEQESLAQKIATSFKRDIFSLPQSRSSEKLEQQTASQSMGNRPPRQVTQEQIERVANSGNAVGSDSAMPIQEKSASPEWDPMVLENMGIQKLSKGINIFRLAHYRLSQTNLQREAGQHSRR